MTVIRLIPATDDGPFPYDAAARLLRALEDVEIGEVDFPAMIESGKRIGWPAKMIESHWALMARGKCFTFHGGAEPFLQGTMYEDNVFFSFRSAQHEAACRPAIEGLAKRLRVRVMVT